MITVHEKEEEFKLSEAQQEMLTSFVVCVNAATEPISAMDLLKIYPNITKSGLMQRLKRLEGVYLKVTKRKVGIQLINLYQRIAFYNEAEFIQKIKDRNQAARIRASKKIAPRREAQAMYPNKYAQLSGDFVEVQPAPIEVVQTHLVDDYYIDADGLKRLVHQAKYREQSEQARKNRKSQRVYAGSSCGMLDAA
jgi:hypothetical protein